MHSGNGSRNHKTCLGTKRIDWNKIGNARRSERSAAKELNKPIEYVNLPIADWRNALVETVGFPEFLATHLAAVAQDHQDGVFSAETNVVEKIGGRPPQSLEQFIQAHLAEFSAVSELEQQAKYERRGA